MQTNIGREITDLKNDLIEMGAFVENCVKDSFVALRDNDKSLLDSIISRDTKTDAMEKEIESRCLRLLVTLSPRARDFRFIAAVLKIITDLERIGDQTQNISEIQKFINDRFNAQVDLPVLSDMYKTVQKMLRLSMDAFVAEEPTLAYGIDEMDNKVDKGFLQVRENIINKIREGVEDPGVALDLLQIAKYVERIGDHAENISEWVIYAHTGSHPSLNNQLEK